VTRALHCRASRALGIVLGATLAGPTWAHDPPRRDPVTRPSVEVPPGVHVDPAIVRELRARATPPAPAGTRSLRQLVAGSEAIVVGQTAATEYFDAGKLRLYRLRVDRTLHGRVAADEVAVVEAREGSERHPRLPDAVPLILLLRPAPSRRYLTEYLPAGSYLALAGGRDGVLAFADDAERTALEQVLAEAVRIGTLSDEAEAFAATRTLAFRELASGNPRLAADAVLELRHVDPLRDLAGAEVAALRTALASRTVPATTRIALLHLLADRRASEAGPAVAAAAVDSGPVLDAVLAARAALGVPAGRVEHAPYLEATDPAVRASAIRGFAALPDPGSGEIGRAATGDPDARVRIAAIDALGTVRWAGALPVLSQTFAQPEPEIRQASGRAILAIGGPAATDALLDLALHGASSDTRTHAAFLLMVTGGRDSEPVRRLLASGPSPDVQQMIEHGQRWQDTRPQGATE
jgi:hypothetical protein